MVDELSPQLIEDGLERPTFSSWPTKVGSELSTSRPNFVAPVCLPGIRLQTAYLKRVKRDGLMYI